MPVNTSMKIVKKSDEKKAPVSKKVEMATPINDTESFEGIPFDQIRVQAPADGSIPTWRMPNGKVLPMAVVRLADGSHEFRPRKKKGPAVGKKYRPRAKKIAQLMQMGDMSAQMNMAPAAGTTPFEATALPAVQNEEVAALMSKMQAEYQKLMALRSLMA